MWQAWHDTRLVWLFTWVMLCGVEEWQPVLVQVSLRRDIIFPYIKATAQNPVAGELVAGLAGQVRTLRGHMHINRDRWVSPSLLRDLPASRSHFPPHRHGN